MTTAQFSAAPKIAIESPEVMPVLSSSVALTCIDKLSILNHLTYSKSSDNVIRVLPGPRRQSLCSNHTLRTAPQAAAAVVSHAQDLSFHENKQRNGWALRWNIGGGEQVKCRGDWRCAIWSDKATFEVGKTGRIWITRRTDQQCCADCVKSIFLEGFQL
jgi:hypothetical protein